MLLLQSEISTFPDHDFMWKEKKCFTELYNFGSQTCGFPGSDCHGNLTNNVVTQTIHKASLRKKRKEK